MPTGFLPATPPAAIIFDLDGTLVDTVGIRIAAWKKAFAEWAIPVDDAHLAGLIGSDGRRLAREVAGAARVSLPEGEDEAIDARSGAIFTQMNRRPRPLPGVRDLVAHLDRTGLAWAVATSSRREQVAASIDALDLPTSPLVVDGTQVSNAKPAPDLLLLCARALGVEAADCWYVGDATWDMHAAVAAGMLPIGVTSGAADRPTLLRSGASVVVDSLVELGAALG